MKITVVGAGYVGLANAVLLARHHEVTLVDISEKKVSEINMKKSPIVDKDISMSLKNDDLNLRATTNLIDGCKNSQYVLVCVPTNYDDNTRFFDCSIVESVVSTVLEVNKLCIIVVKSTVYVGFTKLLCEKYTDFRNCILFSPEFLREGSSLYDCYHPSRIVVGGFDKYFARKFANVYSASTGCNGYNSVLITEPSEAEAIKLFSNSYLAMRVSYFNELDCFAKENDLQCEDIVKGVCLDPRIGTDYNNPSFGYGGYCLPKDSKQLRSQTDTPLISAIVESNKYRKNFIVNDILRQSPNIVGVYKLSMKLNSDNSRESSVLDIINSLISNGIDIIIYEKEELTPDYLRSKCIQDLDKFKEVSSIILANRYNVELNDVLSKVYTRDIYGVN